MYLLLAIGLAKMLFQKPYHPSSMMRVRSCIPFCKMDVLFFKTNIRSGSGRSLQVIQLLYFPILRTIMFLAPTFAARRSKHLNFEPLCFILPIPVYHVPEHPFTMCPVYTYVPPGHDLNTLQPPGMDMNLAFLCKPSLTPG